MGGLKLSAACEEMVRGELARRMPGWGTRKRLAHDLNTSVSAISDIMCSRRRVPEVLAWRLLARIREEELELAERIEAELRRPSLLKERDW